MGIARVLRGAGARARWSTAVIAAVTITSSLSFTGERAEATVTPQWVPVPITDAARAADPNLSNFRTYDLQVTQSGGDHWAGTDLRVTLEAGKFYVPPANDQRWARSNLWPASPNLAFDTFITSPDSLASPSPQDGTPNTGSHLIVLGEASYPTLGTPGAAGTMPDVTNGQTTIDIAYGDLYVLSSAFND